jgi:hypothetical protein
VSALIRVLDWLTQVLRMIDALTQERAPLVLDVSFGVDAEHEAFADRIVAERLAESSMRPIVRRRP